MLHQNAPIPMKQPEDRYRLRLRFRLVNWLLKRLSDRELKRVCRIAFLVLPSYDRKALWHDFGTWLNVENDGTLDLGRPREGNDDVTQ